MANARGKEVDTTFLSLAHATERGFIHRDYIAHVFRWTHVAKYLMQQHRFRDHHVLDVGCGRELPLAKMMYSMRMTHTTGSYTGVDFGPIPWPESISKGTTKWNMTLHEKTDFLKFAKDVGPTYDVITSFEVLEHVEPFHSYQLLKAMRQVATPRARIFISTPCYDQATGAADNHVNEMTFNALRALIGLAGFSVEKVWGTFANQRDYKKELSPEMLELFEELGEYYDSNILAVMFAPLFPEWSRNCLWRLVAGPIEMPTPKELPGLEQPAMSSSARWGEDFKKILADAKRITRRG